MQTIVAGFLLPVPQKQHQSTEGTSVVVLGLEMSLRTNFESLVLALKVKSLALTLKVKSLALALKLKSLLTTLEGTNVTIMMCNAMISSL